MNNYKEKYISLEEEKSVIEKDKQKLEESLMTERIKLDEEKNKISVLNMQLFNLKCEKNGMLNSKDKMINMLTDSLRVIALGVDIALAVVLYNTVSPTGVAITTLTLLGLTYGSLALLILELAIIKKIDRTIKRNNALKTKNKKEYLQLIEKINNKQQELNHAKTTKNQTQEEINKLTNDINGHSKLLLSKNEELLNLFEQILSETLQEPLSSETMWPFQELRTNPTVKKRVKVPGNNAE